MTRLPPPLRISNGSGGRLRQAGLKTGMAKEAGGSFLSAQPIFLKPCLSGPRTGSVLSTCLREPLPA
jgi:hypothetical protein